MLRYAVALVVALTTSSGNVLAQDLAQYRLELIGQYQPFELGADAQVHFRVHYRNARPGQRLYLLPIPLDGDQGIIGSGRLSLSHAQFNACGTFGNRGVNPYGIAAEHYPLTMSSTAARILGPLGMAREQIESITGGDADSTVALTMGFLVSTPATGDGVVEASFKFHPARTAQWYDGLLLVPFEVTLHGDRDGCATYTWERMNVVRVGIAPIGPRPEQAVGAPKREATGTVEVTQVSPRGTALVVGAPNRVRVDITYRDVPPRSAVYVMVLAQRGDSSVVRPDGAIFTASSFSFSTCELQAGSGFYRVAAESRPIRAEMPYLQTVEAAWIGDINSGGSGTLSGEISFVPPPFSTTYEAIYLHPLVVWEEEGKLCTRRDPKLLRALRVPISGG